MWRAPVCVFLGSSDSVPARHAAAARELGRGLAERGAPLIYGGASVGLMGILADAVLVNGGEAIGILPEALAERELAHQNLTRLELVSSLHTRKARMAELARAFVALPGGYGTLDELFEITTWAQLGLHDKPIVVCNVDGYFDDVLSFVRQAVQRGFIREHQQHLWQRADSAANALKILDDLAQAAVGH